MSSSGKVFLRGLIKHCPRCGSGHLFRHWFTMVPDCPRCGLHFEREEAFFLGALMINLAITMGALLAVWIIGFAATLPNVPVVALAVAAGFTAALTPIVFYPFSKTLWCAMDIMLRRSMGEQFGGDGAQPGFHSKA